jgi:hypothetical protein
VINFSTGSHEINVQNEFNPKLGNDSGEKANDET